MPPIELPRTSISYTANQILTYGLISQDNVYEYQRLEDIVNFYDRMNVIMGFCFEYSYSGYLHENILTELTHLDNQINLPI